MNDILDVLDGMTDVTEETTERIMAQLLNKDDIQLKTEINSPASLARLTVISQVIEDMGVFTEGDNPIRLWMSEYLANQVSLKRGSRKEFTDMITHQLGESIRKMSDELMDLKK